MMNKPYHIYYNHITGRVIIYKNNQNNQNNLVNRNNIPQRFLSPARKQPILNQNNQGKKDLKINNPNNVNIEKNTLNLKSYPVDNIESENIPNIPNLKTYNIESNTKSIFTKIDENKNKDNNNINLKSYTIDNQDNQDNQYNQYINLSNDNIDKKKNIESYMKKEMENLKKFNDINSLNNNETYFLKKNNNENYFSIKNNDINSLEKKDNIDDEEILFKKNSNTSLSENNYSKQNLIYGIKKTILSDFNHLYYSSNSGDFKIGINRDYSKNTFIYDTFYLFPNISEINTKKETNIINEKKVEIFYNKNNNNDIQFFPIDFIPCGLNIPLKSSTNNFKKIIIKNIYWNIFQSINSNNYESNEILSIVPQKNIFAYNKIKLQINFELHSQIASNILNKLNDELLPYKKDISKYSTPANTCLYKIININIDKLNGSYFDNLEIELINQEIIDCALLCVRISVPKESSEILKGIDKYNNISFGNIPFSQFILNFDYDMI
jgi:hypothetical protein